MEKQICNDERARQELCIRRKFEDVGAGNFQMPAEFCDCVAGRGSNGRLAVEKDHLRRSRLGSEAASDLEDEAAVAAAEIDKATCSGRGMGDLQEPGHERVMTHEPVELLEVAARVNRVGVFRRKCVEQLGLEGAGLEGAFRCDEMI